MSISASQRECCDKTIKVSLVNEEVPHWFSRWYYRSEDTGSSDDDHFIGVAVTIIIWTTVPSAWEKLSTRLITLLKYLCSDSVTVQSRYWNMSSAVLLLIYTAYKLQLDVFINDRPLSFMTNCLHLNKVIKTLMMIINVWNLTLERKQSKKETTYRIWVKSSEVQRIIIGQICFRWKRPIN